jgi:hypothetical protein
MFAAAERSPPRRSRRSVLRSTYASNRDDALHHAEVIEHGSSGSRRRRSPAARAPRTRIPTARSASPTLPKRNVDPCVRERDDLRHAAQRWPSKTRTTGSNRRHRNARRSWRDTPMITIRGLILRRSVENANAIKRRRRIPATAGQVHGHALGCDWLRQDPARSAGPRAFFSLPHFTLPVRAVLRSPRMAHSA